MNRNVSAIVVRIFSEICVSNSEQREQEASPGKGAGKTGGQPTTQVDDSVSSFEVNDMGKGPSGIRQTMVSLSNPSTSGSLQLLGTQQVERQKSDKDLVDAALKAQSGNGKPPKLPGGVPVPIPVTRSKEIPGYGSTKKQLDMD